MSLQRSGSFSCCQSARPWLLRWRLLPHFRFFTTASSPSRPTSRQSTYGHTLAGRGWLRPRGPRPSCWSDLQRRYEWHALSEFLSRQWHQARTPGKTVGKEDGEKVLQPASLPLPLESPNHSAANWLSDHGGLPLPYGSMRHSSAW